MRRPRPPPSQSNRTCNNFSLCDRLPPVPPPLHSPPVPGSETTARPSTVNAPLQPSHPTPPTPLDCGPKPTLSTPHFNPSPARSSRMRPQTPAERLHKWASARKTTLSGHFRLCNSSRPLESPLRASQGRYRAFPPPTRGRQTTRSPEHPASPLPQKPNSPHATIQRKPIIPLRIQPMLPHHQNLSHRRR